MGAIVKSQMPCNGARIAPVRCRHQEDAPARSLAFAQIGDKIFLIGQRRRIDLYLAREEGFENRRPFQRQSGQFENAPGREFAIAPRGLEQKIGAQQRAIDIDIEVAWFAIASHFDLLVHASVSYACVKDLFTPWARPI